MFSYEVRVPRDRIAVLIGKEGSTKDELEDLTKSRLNVDSKEGLVTVSGEDAVSLYQTQQIVKAIARGFNPDVAFLLLKHDYAFELLDLTDFSKQKNHQQRMKGRVIGHGGKARKVIEDLAECRISVYGKTIGIISQVDTIAMAKQAVLSLLEGANHSTVYKTLERKHRELRLSRAMGSDSGHA